MARKPPPVEGVQQDGIERVVVALVSAIWLLAPPWLVMMLLVTVAAIYHQFWGHGMAVAWTTMAGTLVTIALTGLTWLVSHQRGSLGRIHSTLTAASAGLWFVIANITGVTAPVTAGMAAFGGVGLCIGWDIRVVIRRVPSEESHPDPLRAMLSKAIDKTMPGARVRTQELTPHKVVGEVDVPPGKTVDDLQKRLPVLEAAAGVPPGAFQVAPNRDNAGKAHFTGSDPRIMDAPIPWPGPSRPGGSIAEPVRIGVHADSEPAEPVMTDAHVQMMGASGSGKSIGGAWNFLGEAITRRDVAIFGIDISKGDQTLGPLRPALHRLEITKGGASMLIEAIYREIPKRTQWLTQHGYTDWMPGCGLLFWILWIEEAAKVFGQLTDKDIERLEEIAKELRSAGGRLCSSLQKSIFSEMSTTVRSQLSYMCFGLNDSADAQYGLSERQQRADCSPELWGAGNSEHQGKAYLDLPGIDAVHAVMPMRTYHWGPKDQAAAAMAAHAAQWPAASRDMDEFTARIASIAPASKPKVAAPVELDTDEQDDPIDVIDPEMLIVAAEHVIAAQHASTAMLQRKLRLSHADCLRIMEILERKGIVGPMIGEGIARKVLIGAENATEALDELRDGDATSDYLRTPDPDPDVTAGPTDEIPDPTPDEDVLEAPEAGTATLDEAQARRAVEQLIRQRYTSGRAKFRATDPELAAIRDAGSFSRPWVNRTLERYVSSGVLEKSKDGKGSLFDVVDLAPLDRDLVSA